MLVNYFAGKISMIISLYAGRSEYVIQNSLDPGNKMGRPEPVRINLQRWALEVFLNFSLIKNDFLNF